MRFGTVVPTLWLSLVLPVVGCGDTSAGASAVTVDTLPGGVVRTMSAAPIEAGRWRLTAARDLQPAESDSAELLDPESLALADDGSLVVVDGHRLQAFDRSGALLRRFGREGSGPGEFRAAFIALRGDTVLVHDPSNGRALSFLWRTGEYLGTVRTACCYWHPIEVDGDGRGVARSILNPPDTTLRNVQAFVRFRALGERADTLFAYERQRAPIEPWVVREGSLVRMAMPVPLAPRAVFAVDPQGGFVTGWTGDYRLRVSRDGRDTVALFGRAIEPRPVSPAEKTRIAESRVADIRRGSPDGVSEQVLRLAFDPSRIPDVHPAYESIAVDRAGRRWIRAADSDTTQVTFDLFDEQGRWLDVVRVPGVGWPQRSWAPVAWSRTEAAVIIEDDAGRPLIRVYSITRR